MDHFYSDLGLKRRLLTEGLTEAISCATLSSSKQLLNDVIFILFTDKNLFALSTIKNSHNNQLYSSMATNKKHIKAKHYLCTRMKFSHSLMVHVGVSKFDYTGVCYYSIPES